MIDDKWLMAIQETAEGAVIRVIGHPTIEETMQRMDKILTSIEDAGRGLREICARMEEDLDQVELTIRAIQSKQHPFIKVIFSKEEA